MNCGKKPEREGGRPLRILYASDVIPKPAGGGYVVALRHLSRLAKAHSLQILTPEHPCGLEETEVRCMTVPKRRTGLPPFRHRWPLLCRARSAVMQAYLTRQGLVRPDIVITICWGSTSWLAADLARFWQVPLLAIVHDWWAEVDDPSFRATGDYACKHASRILVVSDEMQNALVSYGREKIHLLRPVPERRFLPFAVWRPSHAVLPVVAHVGALNPHHLDYLSNMARGLRPLGGRLLLVCAADHPVFGSLREIAPDVIIHHDYFPDQLQALEFVASTATAITVMYPHSEGAPGLPPTGFPSRFVEFCNLGLPVILAAPATNPVRTWAVRRGWTAAIAPGDTAGLDELLSSLISETGWNRSAAQTRAAAMEEFDAESIHAAFVTHVENCAQGL